MSLAIAAQGLSPVRDGAEPVLRLVTSVNVVENLVSVEMVMDQAATVEICAVVSVGGGMRSAMTSVCM